MAIGATVALAGVFADIVGDPAAARTLYDLMPSLRPENKDKFQNFRFAVLHRP